MIHQIYNTEALATLKEMTDNSIDCIITDPPYFKVILHKKDKDNVEWDRAWGTKLEFITWLELICIELKRVLKPNGSIYLFCSNKMQAEVQVMMSKHFNILNNIIWDKGRSRAGISCVDDMRSYFDTSERIIFAEQKEADKTALYENNIISTDSFIYKDISNYLETERIKAGVSRIQVDEYLGVKGMASRHYFADTQWCLPTEKNYLKMQELFNLNLDSNLILTKNYTEIKEQYDILKQKHQSLRRTFNAVNIHKNLGVWRYELVDIYKENRHICEKPADLIQHIVMTSTLENYTVLDAFCGSGVVGEVCKKTGRNFTGIELDFKWACIAEERLKAIS